MASALLHGHHDADEAQPGYRLARLVSGLGAVVNWMLVSRVAKAFMVVNILVVVAALLCYAMGVVLT